VNSADGYPMYGLKFIFFEYNRMLIELFFFKMKVDIVVYSCLVTSLFLIVESLSRYDRNFNLPRQCEHYAFVTVTSVYSRY